MKIISFYTKNTIYEKEVEDLKTSLESLKIDHFIQEEVDLGSWEANCARKPSFIYECLKKFQEPVLWVDSDAILLKPPSIHLPNCDLALYFNSRKTRHVRSATIYINPTQKAEEFLLLWAETLQKENLKAPTQDQPILIDLVRSYACGASIASLPIEYVQIFDRDEIPLEKSVIVHFQASRTAKMAPIFWKNFSGKELKAMRIGVSET